MFGTTSSSEIGTASAGIGTAQIRWNSNERTRQYPGTWRRGGTKDVDGSQAAAPRVPPWNTEVPPYYFEHRRVKKNSAGIVRKLSTVPTPPDASHLSNQRIGRHAHSARLFSKSIYRLLAQLHTPVQKHAW